MTDTFHNVATADIADEYGALKQQSDALAERLDALKAELKKRTGGDDTIEAAKFTVTVSTSVRTTYDDKAIRAALGEEICKQYERTSETVTLRVKPTVILGRVAS